MPDETTKYTMQILDENGRIVKSETFKEIDTNEKRTITLLPNERKYFDTNYDKLKKPWVNYILASRGLVEIDYEKATVENGILIITKKGK